MLGYVLGAAAVGWLAGESLRRGRRLGDEIYQGPVADVPSGGPGDFTQVLDWVTPSQAIYRQMQAHPSKLRPRRTPPPAPAPTPTQPLRPAAPHGFQMQRLGPPTTTPEEWRGYMQRTTGQAPTQSQWGPASGSGLGPTGAAQAVTGPQARLPYAGGMPGAFGGAMSLPGGGMAYQGPALMGPSLGCGGAVSPTGVQRGDEENGSPFELGRTIALV